MFIVSLLNCPSVGCHSSQSVPALIPVNVWSSSGVASSSHNLIDSSGLTPGTAPIHDGVNGFFDYLECDDHQLCAPCPPVKVCAP